MYLMLIFSIMFVFHESLCKGRSSSGWGPWSEWVCSATCGGGGGRKTRVCVDPGPNKCRGGKQKFGKCSEEPCPKVTKPMKAKGWTPWMSWECPVTCGGGTGTRSRICEDPDICEGPEEENGPCAEEPCPADPNSLNNELQGQIEQQLETSKHNVLVTQGEIVSVYCKDKLAASIDREYPDATAKWIRNGNLVRVDGKRIKLKSNGNLKVKAAVEDNGLWWCSLELTPKTAVTLSFVAFGVQNDKPDIEVEMGYRLEMKCLATALGRLVRRRFDQKWIHNSTTYREEANVKPEEVEKFQIPSSNYSHSGIWNCRYTERGVNLPTKREWVTNVIWVLVIPPKNLLQKFIPYIVIFITGMMVISVAGWLHWKRLKRNLLEDKDREEDEDD